MSTVVFRNSQEAFIHKHISKILTDKGHDVSDISRAADFAVETYRIQLHLAELKAVSVSNSA